MRRSRQHGHDEAVLMDARALGVLLSPPAAGSRAGDTDVRDAGRRRQVPTGGVHAGQHAQPGTAEVLARLLLAVGLDGVRHVQALGQGREQRAVQFVDLFRDAGRAQGVRVCALRAVTGLRLCDDGVRRVVQGAELDFGGHAEPVADACRSGKRE